MTEHINVVPFSNILTERMPFWVYVLYKRTTFGAQAKINKLSNNVAKAIYVS